MIIYVSYSYILSPQVKYFQNALAYKLITNRYHGVSFRHLFTAMDGGHGTSGPTSFKGPIGQTLSPDIHLTPPVRFEPVKTEVSELAADVSDDLSADQQLIYTYCRAVHTGSVPASAVRKKPGPLNHSRWLTLAIRVLVLYTRTANPSNELCSLTQFIQQVYAPVWFRVKAKPQFWCGAVHQFYMMTLVRSQSESIQNVVRPVIQRNAYFAHAENVLVAMLADTEKLVRDVAVDKILTARKRSVEVRAFRVPKLNWDCQTYTDMISWSTFSEPPATRHMPDEVIASARDKPLSFPEFPCHAQSIERCVKLVTEASSRVFGYERRHAFIVSRQAARRQRRNTNTKADFTASRRELP